MPDSISRREVATQSYLRTRERRRLMGITTFTLLIASIVAGHAGLFARADNDWSQFDRRTFTVLSAVSGDSFTISIDGFRLESVQLIGVAAPLQSRDWLANLIAGRQATLLLETPQTRDAAHRLRAYAYVDNRNVSFELVKAGMAFADRRSKCEMDGLIEPAESEARKKKLGMWADLKPEQMPQWRQDWLKGLPRRVAANH